MVISRGQMSKQLEPGLGNKDLKRFKEVIKKTHGTIYKEKTKSNRKNSKI
jgi:hypothetical protein